MGNIKIEEGKVYLRDTRNGNIHPYENLLGQMSYMVRFIGGKPGDEVPKELRPQPPMADMTPQERAAEYDKRARMSNEEREAYDAEQEAARKQQKVADETPVEEPKRRFKFTAKANGIKWEGEEGFKAKGWTEVQLLQHGMAVAVADDAQDFDFEV